MIAEEPPYPAFASAVELDQAIDRIAKATFDFRVEFLFGAGMSIDCGVPSGGELSMDMVRGFFPSPTDRPDDSVVSKLVQQYPLEAVAEALQRRPGAGRSDLTELVRTILLRDGMKPGETHDIFLSICFWDMLPRVKRVFTTNFDDLIERVFDRKGISIHKKNFASIRDAERLGRIPIVHLHGMLESEYQLTESDVFRSAYNPTHALFRSALAEADAFVMVGYSMTDPDFRSLYMRYREDIQARDPGGMVEDKTTYVVAPCSDGHAYALGSRIWKSRGAIWIPLSARDFFAKVRLFMEDRSGRALLSNLRKKLAYGDDEGLNQVVARVADSLCIDQGNALGFLREVRTRSGSPR